MKAAGSRVKCKEFALQLARKLVANASRILPSRSPHYLASFPAVGLAFAEVQLEGKPGHANTHNAGICRGTYLACWFVSIGMSGGAVLESLCGGRR